MRTPQRETSIPARTLGSVRRHRMSPADFDRCEKDWYRMLGERRRMFDRYLLGMRCARYAVSGMWIIAFAIVGLTLVEVSS